MMAMEAIADDPVPVPDPPVTVTVTLLVTGPLKPAALAVIVVVPAPTAVTMPVAAPTVATPVMAEVQATWVVMFALVAWAALPYVPVAVSCKVGPPTTRPFVVGVTAMESSPELLQLASGRRRPASRSALRQKRSDIEDSLPFQMILHPSLLAWLTKAFLFMRNQDSQ